MNTQTVTQSVAQPVAHRAEISPALVRSLFSRRSSGSVNHDFIAREVARRMAERLAYIRIDPQCVLDAGCGNGADLGLLRARFPQADLLGIDLAARLSLQPRGLLPTLQRITGRLRGTPLTAQISGDFAQLPLAAGSLDAVWSNLALHWHSQPHLVFPEWQRALRVGGLVMFSTFGPDTLKEVRQAFAAAGLSERAREIPRVIPFTDMHDYGDMLVAAGFATPVMDMELLTLTYSDSASFWADVRALGGNPMLTRAKGLLGRQAAKQINDALEAGRDTAGRLTLTFELIYGHAWKGEPKKTADGRTIVRVQRKDRT